MATFDVLPSVKEGVAWLSGLSRAPLQRFTMHIPPVPVPRPTVNRRTGGVFYRGNYPEYSAALRRAMTEVWADREPLDGELGILVDFRCPRTQPKLLVPKGDIDNYLKGPMDALKPARIVADDVQFTIAVAAKRFVESGPGFTMWIVPLIEGLGLKSVPN